MTRERKPFAENPWSSSSFHLEEWVGEIKNGFRDAVLAASGASSETGALEAALEGLVERLADPGSADATIHWGRNYLYRTRVAVGPDASIPVVVKQFTNQGLKKTTDRRLRGSKALRGWRMGVAFHRAGVPTAEPLVLVESRRADGPSLLVTRHLDNVFESRYLFRALNAGELDEHYPGFDLDAFFDTLGATLRHMHEAGLFHRDLSIGNVLLPEGENSLSPGDIALIDLNRARRFASLGDVRRSRDLCRLEIHDREHQRRFVDAYWGGRATPRQWALYLASHHGFHWRIRGKRNIRRPFRALGKALSPRTAHPHLQMRPAEAGASLRDRIVWDPLSDQPHQHAGKLARNLVRVLDVPSYLGQVSVFARNAPSIWRRFRELQADLGTRSVPWSGAGVCVRPFPDPAAGPGTAGAIDPEEGRRAVVRGVEDLGVRHVLLRLHPWEENHDAEEALARDLHERGLELVYVLPQNRDLVRDPGLWSARVEELAERFVPYGRAFQVGQAINRSKWGVWKLGEYLPLAHSAAEILRRYPGVEVVGPGIIDFELHTTASVVNLPWCPSFDALASLLYVDRRGAPENRQLGFDTVDKVLLAKAVADTSRACAPRSWITEVNWPLREGPHSPAGKAVSVDEERQADYLVRYFLLALTTGAVERVYWWQLVARGYGLIAPQDTAGDDLGLRRRPSFAAFATLERMLRGYCFLSRLPAPDGVHLLRFAPEETTKTLSGEMIVGWCERGEIPVELPSVPRDVVLRDGQNGEAGQEKRVLLGPSARYFRI